MLAYLENPRQDSVRSLNFAISGFNIQDNGGQNGPCVMDTACTQIPMSKSVCEDNQGVWWGEGYDEDSVIDNGGKGYKNCCAVNQALAGKGLDQLNIFPERSVAVRDATLKLVRNTTQSYDATNKSCGYTESDELYLVNEEAPKPLLDNPEENLLGKGGNLEPAMQKRYEALVASMESILASDPACPGDGNRDGVVNEEDMANWRRIAQEWGQSSVYDMFIDGQVDGLTNALDAQIIQQNMGKTCPKAYAQY